MRQISPTLTATGKTVRRPRGKFTKREFHYDSAGDVYHCPAGCELTFAYQEHNALGRGYREYCGRECGDCPLRSQCTDSVRGHTLQRLSAKSSEHGWPSYLTIRWRGRDIGGVRRSSAVLC